MKPATLILLACCWLGCCRAEDVPPRWRVHDLARPKPRRVQPPPQALPAAAPADAVVLFDGSGMAEWTTPAGGTPPWKVSDGALVVTPGTGKLATKQAFGDAQIHLEWAAPSPATGRGQGRGNSGVHVMGLYEVQILDCHENETYADGYTGAIYGQHPPLVNACRPPGEWQSLDIAFRRPRFDGKGLLLAPARMTVHVNGVLVQDNSEVQGPTLWLHYLPYRAHADRLPFTLQEHGNPVRFRNIWVRDLESSAGPAPKSTTRTPERRLDAAAARAFTGEFVGELRFTVDSEAGRLRLSIPERGQMFRLRRIAELEFELEGTDARVRFAPIRDGRSPGFDFIVAGDLNQSPRRR